VQPKLTPPRRRDILLLIFSLFSIAALTGRGVYQIITGLTYYRYSLKDLSSSLFDGIGMFFCAAMLLPLIFYTIQKLKGHEIRVIKLPPVKFWQVGVIILIWSLAIILGSVLDNTLKNEGLMALPFFLLGIAIPVACLVWIAIGGLQIGSWRRFWAAFGISMTGSTLGAILLEYIGWDCRTVNRNCSCIQSGMA